MRLATGIAMTLFVLHGCTREPPAPVAREPRQVAPQRATLQKVVGEVLIKRAAGDEWTPAGEATALFDNDKVRTTKGGSALVQFTNGSSVTLGEDALIGIADTQVRPGQDRSDVTVLRGRVDAELSDPHRQSLTVSTPAATVRAGREIVFQ